MPTNQCVLSTIAMHYAPFYGVQYFLIKKETTSVVQGVGNKL